MISLNIDDIKADDLYAEIADAEKARNAQLRRVRRLIHRYVGNWWRAGMGGEPRPENTIFAYIAQLLPQIIFNNPSVSVTPLRAETGAEPAKWMRDIINAWIRSTGVHGELEMTCMDMLFGYGVMGVNVRDLGGVTQPRLFRIAPEAFLLDPQCPHWKKARFMGHQYSLPLEAIKADPMADPDAVANLQADDSREYGGERSAMDTVRNPVKRNNVTLYDVFLPDLGVVCTLARQKTGDNVFVRRPTEYVGISRGPYTLFGVYGVPSSPWPLSPIVAMGDMDEELNAHLAAAALEAEATKSFVLVDGAIPGAKNIIENVPPGGVATIAGMSRDAVTTVNVGGTSQSRMVYIAERRMSMDRQMGQSDMRRGRPQGVTATEAALANNAADSRTHYITQAFINGAKQALQSVGWYFYHLESSVMWFSYEDRQRRKREAVFIGGVREGVDPVDWAEDFILDIEPHSMRRVDPIFEAERANTVLQTAVTLAPAMIQFPHINWREVVNRLGDANNMPDLYEMIVNQDILGALSAAAVAPAIGAVPAPADAALPPASGTDSPGGYAPGLTTTMAGGPVLV